ncbi:MAG: hypothetical protein JNK82_30870 [Myxococcaceae bacterium]|nr:hypothetical protein [Myxococcaceae bacterium]
MTRRHLPLFACFALACGPLTPEALDELQADGASEQASLGFGQASPLVLYRGVKSGATLSLTRSAGDLADESWSDGDSGADSARSLYVPPGREATVCEDVWYRGACQRLLPNSPGFVWDLLHYGLAGKASSIEYRPLGGVSWTEHEYLSTYPNHRNNELSRDIQGVAHSSGFWFISKTTKVFRIPLGADLNASSFGYPELHVNDIPGSCDHIGDIDFYSGELFIPLEGCDGANRQGDDRIAVYRIAEDGSFVFQRQLLLGNQDEAPWVAVNPINGLMYSSDFDAAGDTVVRAYERSFTNGVLTQGQRFRVLLTRHFSGVQGGTFDDRGNLYLTEHAESGAGIYVYRIAGGYGTEFEHIGPNGFKWKGSHWQEMEGIDWWDLTQVSADMPGIDTGPGAASLHWLLLDNDSGDDDEFYFKHVRLY